MHRIFVTEGIVLGKRGVGEANTQIALLTRKQGLIRTSARSARLQKSKLRYGLEPLTHGVFSSVRGRYEWKLVGAEKLSREYLGDSTLRRKSAGRIARLILRLIHGEESVEGVYITVLNGLTYLAHSTSDHDTENIERVLVLRILSHLGYLAHTADVVPFVTSDEFSLELAARAHLSRSVLVRAINESLIATGL